MALDHSNFYCDSNDRNYDRHVSPWVDPPKKEKKMTNQTSADDILRYMKKLNLKYVKFSKGDPILGIPVTWSVNTESMSNDFPDVATKSELMDIFHTQTNEVRKMESISRRYPDVKVYLSENDGGIEWKDGYKESDTAEQLQENVLTRLWIRTKEYFDMEYSIERTRSLIQDYIDDGRIEELKNVLVVLRLNVDKDNHKGFFKKLGQMLLLTAHFRLNYLQYKREILPLIFWAANEISKAEGRKFDFEFYYANTTGQLQQRMDDIEQYNKFYDFNRGTNPNLQTLQVLNSMTGAGQNEGSGDAISRFSNLHAASSGQYYNNSSMAANLPSNSR
jgi:hypothetical protein